MLSMSFESFDQGPDGWRSLDSSLACSAYADDVLAAYRARHGQSLTPANRSLLIWHEAQTKATQGATSDAINLMKRAAFPGEPEWQQLYREGSIAFLEDDLTRLQVARDTLERLPAIPQLTMSDGTRVTSPPNLDVLDGLISCFGKPYSVAYTCRSPPGE